MESITQKNPLQTIVIGDFNARLSKWCTDDKTTQKGLYIENLFSQFSLSKLINKPLISPKTLTFVLICFLQINKI